MASLIFYVQYIKKGLNLKYLLFALLIFLVAIFSKAMAASFISGVDPDRLLLQEEV